MATIESGRHVSRRLLRWLVASFAVGGALMALAGQWTSPYLWGFAVGFSGVFLYASLAVLDDDLARERFRPPSNGFDAVALAWIRAAALALFVLAPLDSGRFHWSRDIPGFIRVAAIAGSLGGFTLVIRSMMSNRFFSPVIRIQGERGHQVVDHGPYAVIRHPGYLGMLMFAPLASLAVGSLWALIPATVYCLLISRRVVVEDRFLRAHLAGYEQYAGRVRHRVIPGVW